MVALSALSKLLQFSDSWSLNLADAGSAVGDPTSFMSSQVWGDISKMGGLNFSLVADPSTAVVVDKRGDPLPNQEPQIVMQVNYPKGTYRSPGNTLVNNGTIVGGAEFFSRPFGNAGVIRALLEYDLYFPSNFPFNLGGKLPGLYGAMAGKTPDGCSGGKGADGNNCWSARYMWRAFGAGEIYAYLPPSNTENLCNIRTYPLNVCSDPEYGLSLGRTAFKFATGTWNRLALHIQVNTPGQSDGFVQFYLNGEKVIENLNVVFRGSVPSNSLLITDIFFSSFFGGSTLAYATPADTFACFKNLNMSVSNARMEVGTSTTSDASSYRGVLGSIFYGILSALYYVL